MKIKHAKRIILILLATLLASFCMVTLVGAISFVKQNPPQKDIEAAADLTISNLAELQVFANNINNGDTDYSGQTVVLGADIDCKGNKISFGGRYHGVLGWDGASAENRYFKGTFDGQNRTIYNFNIDPKKENKFTNSCYRNEADAFGLFSCIESGTTISNLRLRDFSLSISSATSSYGQTTGGIVGYLNGGKIQNCIVENFSLSATYSSSFSNEMGLGGVFGVGYGTVTNCLVKDIKMSGVYKSAGVGPGDSPYSIQMQGTNFLYYVHTSFYPTEKSTISSCVVQNFVCTDKYAISQYVSGCNMGSGNAVTSSYSHTISNCQNTAGTPSVSSWSSEGGSDQGTTWYYGGSGYNSGYPYLRQFIKNWTTLNFSASEGGTVNPSSIKIPSNADQTLTITSATIGKLNQTITATPDTANGYFWNSWTKNSATSYTANFAIKQYKLSFANSTGDTVCSPSSTQEFTVNSGTSISGPSKGATGTVSYAFGGQTVTYDIPTGYYFDSDNRPQQITSDCRITPNILQQKFDITIGGSGGSWGGWTSVGASSASLTGIVYGTEMEYLVTTSTIVIKINGQQNVFTADSGYEIEYLQINEDYYYPGESGTIKVTSKIDIYAYALKLYEITFAEAIDDEGSSTDKYGQTGIATLTANPKTIKIKQGKSVTAEYNATTRVLTFKYNGNVVAIYTGKEYYAILQDADKDEIKAVNDSSDLTIQPIFTFYACLVTMTKADNDNISEIYVGGSKIASGEHKLIVEFGTTVNFTAGQSNGLFTYTYTFSSGEVVKYQITDDQYAMSSEIVSGTREWHTELENVTNHTFDGPEDGYIPTDDMQYKTISPTFELKFYGGNLA